MRLLNIIKNTINNPQKIKQVGEYSFDVYYSKFIVNFTISGDIYFHQVFVKVYKNFVLFRVFIKHVNLTLTSTQKHRDTIDNIRKLYYKKLIPKFKKLLTNK